MSSCSGRTPVPAWRFMLSATLRLWRDRPDQRVAGGSRPDSLELVNRLVRELGVHPDPERGQWPDRDSDVATTLNLDIPRGWRYEPGYDVIGVLAPAEGSPDGSRWSRASNATSRWSLRWPTRRASWMPAFRQPRCSV